MEKNDLSEAQWAWMLWQLLQRVSDRLRDRYENDFIAFDLHKDSPPPDS
jgi:hypothetical protein